MGAIMAFRSLLLFFVLGPMVFTTGCERKASLAQKPKSPAFSAVQPLACLRSVP